jgi:hypothetical protein
LPLAFEGRIAFRVPDSLIAVNRIVLDLGVRIAAELGDAGWNISITSTRASTVIAAGTGVAQRPRPPQVERPGGPDPVAEDPPSMTARSEPGNTSNGILRGR